MACSDRRSPRVHWHPPTQPGARGAEQPSAYGNFTNIMVTRLRLSNVDDLNRFDY